jgi:hypothetical protein
MTEKKLKNNSRLREKNTYNPKHGVGISSIRADVVTTNKESYNKFTAKWVGFSRNETRNTINDYKAVIIALNEFYINYIIDTGNLVILPNALGKFGIKKFKKTLVQRVDGTFNRRFDMHKYKTTGEKVYFTNDHTEGHTFMWTWIKPPCIQGTRDFNSARVYSPWWKLQVAKKTGIKLAQLLKTEGYNWDKYHYMTSATRERLIRNRIKREEATANA